MNLKNAKEAAESQQRGKAVERQRREEEVPANVAAVNTDGPRARVTSAAASGAPTFGPTPGVIPGGKFVHGELYVVLTNSRGRKVCVPYATVSGALAQLAQPCAHTAGTTCPCGASLSRWCLHCKQERTEFFARSTKEEASAAGTDAEEDGNTGTATPPEPLEAGGGGPSQGASATPQISHHLD